MKNSTGTSSANKPETGPIAKTTTDFSSILKLYNTPTTVSSRVINRNSEAHTSVVPKAHISIYC